MILQELVDRYERESRRGRVAPFGASMEQISFMLIVDHGGKVIDVQDMRADRRTPRIPMPTPPKSTVNVEPRFLYGNTAYLLGVKTQAQRKKLPTDAEQKNNPAKAAAKIEKVERRCSDEHAAWTGYHREALKGSDDDGLKAVLRFIETWTPEQITGLRYADEITAGTLALRLDHDVDDNGTPRLISDRPAAKAIWDHLSGPDDVDEGVCIITGRRGPIERLHPSIKGVRGAQPSGASLVSFNCEAVEHVGPNSQGRNAPVSVIAAHAYATALNALLADPMRQTQVGDATAVFWVETDGEAANAEALLAALLGGAGFKATEEGETARLRETLVQIAAGRPLAQADPSLDPDTRYRVLALGPSAARIVVRWYLAGNLGELAGRVGEHWQDMQLEPLPWRTPPSVQWLALQTVPARAKNDTYERDKTKINPTLPGDLLRAILTGRRYPFGLLQTLVQRLSTDRDINGLRVATIRACLARDHRLGLITEGAPMALDTENPSTAYQLGRLFAVLGSAYRRANPDSEVDLANGSYRQASTQPAAAFPRLLATAQHHLSAIRRAGKVGLAIAVSKEIEEIAARLGTTFPASLNVADQGRFALGYYHQKGYRKPATTEPEGLTP
jgi:CRISPR-associated protein Csd1